MLTRFIPLRVTVHAYVRSISLCPPTLIMSVHLSSGSGPKKNPEKRTNRLNSSHHTSSLKGAEEEEEEEEEEGRTGYVR